jgi:hypothetical protein
LFTTVIHHILRALVHGEKPDLTCLAKFAQTEYEWRELEKAKTSAGVDVTSAPDTNMICGELDRSGLGRGSEHHEQECSTAFCAREGQSISLVPLSRMVIGDLSSWDHINL